MTIYLKQSTASQEIPLGYFLDSVDGNTEETGLTINASDIKLWKAGATTLANKNSGGATHISNGVYYAVLDATDTDTLGSLVIFVHVAGALSVRLECVVLAANVYASFIGNTDTLDVQVTGIGAGVITATSIASDAITAAKIATDAIDADALKADAATEIANAVATVASGSPLAVNVTQISGSSTAADNLEEAAEALTPGSAATGTLTTTQFTTNLSGSNDTNYVGRQLTFKGDTTTTALRGVAAWITAYNGSTKAVTVAPALPVAPVNGETFVIG